MTSHPKPPELAPAIRAKLAALRRRIRGYVWLHGLMKALGWLGVAFWASLGIDWFFEPPLAVRGVVLAIAGLGLVAVLFRWIVRRAFVRLSNRNMAMLLERYFPQFDERLLTAVELADGPADLGPHHRAMLAETCRQAAAPIGDVRLRTVFNPGPLQWSIVTAVVLATGVGTFAMTLPEAFGVWSRRSLLLHEELWPRKTRLVVEGFENGLTKVARGADVEVIAKADLSMPLVPSLVEIRYQTGGARLRATMSREGAASPAEDPFQEYSHTFRGVLAPIGFDVIGGDAAVRDLRIEVVDSPTIVDMQLECRFPAYMGRPPRVLPVAGMMQLPVGTQLAVRATANKDLVQVEIDDGDTRHVHALDVPQPERANPSETEPETSRRSFTYSIADFTRDRTLSFILLDTDGIRSREPVRLALASVADEPPKLSMHLRGIGSAITPQARLPAVGRVTDDYGVAKTWFEYAVDEQAPVPRPIQTLSGNSTDVELDHALEIRDLGLQPGQKLLVNVKAADRYDLGEGPNVGVSERWLLDVVTPEQLRTMLEARELVLRQRLERIAEEVTETRDSLARIDSGVPGSDDPNQDRGLDGAEPDDLPDDPAEPSPERILALQTLRVQRASQNSRKNAHETLGVAEALSSIREELINNRIDTEELKSRLEDGIAGPLRRIAEEMFPELERRLDRLETALAGEEGGENRRLALDQVDAILNAMQQVLDRMLELEDFNKVVAMLREIIHAQEELGERTRQRHQQKLRELLED